jgi:ankyrin repeat protein
MDTDGRTPLMLAIKKQNAYIIKHLIGKGASKNCVDKKGNTVYHYVATTTKEIVKVKKGEIV